MLVRGLMVLGLMSLFVAAGCHKADAVGCTETAACPGGHVCLHGVCTQRCDTSDDCPAGQHCAVDVCADGTGNEPAITAVTSSDGSTTDATCNKPAENTTCLGSHLTVQGTNLNGATFALTQVGNPSVSFPLTAGAGATATQANLVFAFADQAEADAQLLPGNYTLSAVNAAGSAQVVISLLRGASSGAFSGADIIAAINDETTGTIDAARLDLPRADDLITEINLGTSQIDAARVDLSGVGGGGGGSIHVQRTAATAGTAVQVDSDANFGTYCGDEDGCEITMGYRYFMVSDPTPGLPYTGDETFIPTLRWGIPCRFHIDNSHHWSVSNHCYAAYKIWNGVADAYLTVHSSQGYGTDGYDGTSGSDRLAVLTYWAVSTEACILSESDPTVVTDTTVGLFFYMNDAADASFASANRTCELLIKD
ncbi:MAG: hypothetical protein AAB426_06875 [Myxococcota bacterium]